MRWTSRKTIQIYTKKNNTARDTVFNYLNLAIRRMRQVIGRGVRSPDVRCSITICDSRWPKIESFVLDRFKPQWQAKSYSEGQTLQVTLSKNERSSYLRKLALKKYRLECYACGLVPKTANQIDIHLLDPISEGERETTIDDLIPLCASCHRLAHSERPPLTIEEIQAFLQ